MKILVALPDNSYFLWQMLVQINNFRKLGLEDKTTYVIGKTTLQKSNILTKIMKDGGIKSTFVVFNDDRINPEYSPSLRPHILAKYYETYPEAENETFLLLDPDVIFTNRFDISNLEKDNIWYLSDTRSYIGSKYIKSKSEELFKNMCNIVGIDPKIVEDNEENAGGAQYLIKNVSIDYWRKTERDSEQLYKYMLNTSDRYLPEYPIQAWTAGMWADLWNAWYFGYKTKISKDLEFSWATDKMEKWNTTNIFHNAGAVNDDNTLFIKTKYQISPFNQEIICSEDYCSYKYMEEVKETEINFQKILF